MAASFIQLAVDGAGKKVQTFENGSNEHAHGVVLLDSSNNDLGSGGRYMTVGGNVAHDAADSGNPIKVGGKAETTLPTAVADGDRVDALFNEYGELAVLTGERRITISQTPTITAGAYAAKDAVGGKLTFANAARKTGGTAVIEGLIVKDLGQQMAELDLVLFDQDFTSTTDNDPFDPSDADLANCIGVLTIVAADYADFTDNSVGTVQNLKLPITVAATSIYGQLVSRGTPTYTSTSDLQVKLIIRHD